VTDSTAPTLTCAQADPAASTLAKQNPTAAAIFVDDILTLFLPAVELTMLPDRQRRLTWFDCAWQRPTPGCGFQSGALRR
jgi:hypothetical protein